MSKFSKEEQTEIVKWAMNLQGAIESEKVELNRLKMSILNLLLLHPHVE